MNKTNKDLLNFWNNFYKLSNDDVDYINNLDSSKYLELAPSLKQIEALRLFNKSNYVLDYGCGNGWASIIMAKEGTNKVLSVDLCENPINQLNILKKAYDVDNKVDAVLINDKWLENQKDNSFDGFFSSNVIDVIPLELSLKIIKEASRIIKDNSYAIFSLNYYISLEEMKLRKWHIENKSAFIDGVLRLTSLSDLEWSNIFKDYFEVLDIIHYAWPEEKEELRRIFILKKK